MPEIIDIRLTRCDGSHDLPLPAYQTSGSAGMDLLAAVTEPLTLQPGQWRLVPTGLSVSIPHGYEAQVRPRSGLALKHGISVLNTPGTIDSDYRGEIGVILINLGDREFTVNRGDRIAQMVFSPVTTARVNVVEALETSARGNGGFGHTGI